MRTSWWWIGLAWLLLCGVPSPARAEREHVTELHRLGQQHYNLGEYREALKSFRQAYRESDDATFLFNLGQCERALGERREAIALYKSYLRAEGDADNRDEVRGLITRLESELENERVTQKQPPEGTLKPAQIAPPTATAILVAPAPRPSRRAPVYKKWWLWTTVGVLAAGAGVGLAVALTRPGKTPSAPSSEGTFMPFGGP